MSSCMSSNTTSVRGASQIAMVLGDFEDGCDYPGQHQLNAQVGQ